MHKLHALFTITIVVQYVSADTFFVDANNGNDTNNGSTPVSAFRTFKKALIAVSTLPTVTPTQVIFRGGFHFQQSPVIIESHHSNTVFTAYHRETAIISGAVHVPPNAWSGNASEGLVWADVDNLPSDIDPQQMFMNGRRRQRARHPNLFESDGRTVRELGCYMFWKSPICVPIDKKNNSAPCNRIDKLGFKFNQSDDTIMLELSKKNVSRAQAVVYHGWTASRHFITHINMSSRILNFKNPSQRPIGWWSGLRSEGGQRYYLENDRTFLDNNGEWWLDLDVVPPRLYYRLLPDESISTQLNAYLPILRELIVMNNTTNVTFERLGFEHTDWILSCKEHQQCDGQSVEWQKDAAVHMNKASFVNLVQCSLQHHGSNAVWIDTGSRNVTIERCNISDLGTGAIRIGSSKQQPLDLIVRDVIISNTNMSDGSHAFVSGTGVFVQYASHINILHNEISHFSFSGISFGWSWNYMPQPGCGYHTIHGNKIHHLGFPRRETGDAMACIYSLGQNNGTIVSSNLCHDVRAYMSGGYCLSQDQGSSYIVFSKNICLRTTSSPHNTHYGFNLTYTNNIFYDGGHNCWVLEKNLEGYPGALRTSPQSNPCGASNLGFPDKLS